MANHGSEVLWTGEQQPAQGALKTRILSLGFILGATGICKDHVGEGDSTMEAAIVPNLTEEAGDSPPQPPNSSAHWHSSAYHLHKLFLLPIWKKSRQRILGVIGSIHFPVSFRNHKPSVL